MEYLILRNCFLIIYLFNDASTVNLIRHNKGGGARLIGHKSVGVHWSCYFGLCLPFNDSIHCSEFIISIYLTFRSPCTAHLSYFIVSLQESHSCLLSGAVSLCNPFNLVIADEDFHKGFNNVYDKALANSLRKIFKK